MSGVTYFIGLIFPFFAELGPDNKSDAIWHQIYLKISLMSNGINGF
jgi:hypothetical protein